MVSTVREIVRQGMSVNLYMFHGGSSFGFMSGALGDPSYKALVSSYGGFLVSYALTSDRFLQNKSLSDDNESVFSRL